MAAVEAMGFKSPGSSAKKTAVRLTIAVAVLMTVVGIDVGMTEAMSTSAAPVRTANAQALPVENVYGSVGRYNAKDYFIAAEIVEGDAIYDRIIGKSYQVNPNVALSDLRYLKVLHYDFKHEVQEGELIVNKSISDDILAIFRELYEAEYEIEKMHLIDEYWTGDGDSTDTASIEVNNTSAFCYRAATGSSKLSNHAYGCAVDINPQQNPYVRVKDGKKSWSHENATPYIDRTTGDPHVIVEGDVCYNAFVRRGFKWGGAWKNPIDYQHFEKRP